MDKLSQEQVVELKMYLVELSKLNGASSRIVDEWTDDEIASLTVIYRQIGHFGNGDPVLAAQNRTRLMS